jgi:hypothetical protein
MHRKATHLAPLPSFDAEPKLRDDFVVLSLSVDPEGNVRHPRLGRHMAGCVLSVSRSLHLHCIHCVMSMESTAHGTGCS